MGRPRKRQLVESTVEDNVANRQVVPLDLGSVSFLDDGFDMFNHGIAAESGFTNGQSALTFPPETTMPAVVSPVENRHIVWHFGDREILGGEPINFGDIGVGSVDDTTPPLDPAPQLSTCSRASISSQNSPPQTGGPSCSCLASMYLSLASLQQFPSDIVTALKTVRGACATAASTIWCQQCGNILLEKQSPPIEAFQNVMLLGTILPIIANGYRRLLQMVDDETNTAESMRQTKTFRFHDYGGMCGREATVPETLTCAEKESFVKAVEMPPQQWRTTVRALLRVDIYGHEQPGFMHKGLKDLVAEMENRQRSRHDMLDAHVAALGTDSVEVGHFGAPKASNGLGHGHMKCAGEQTHGCLQILQMAKIAIDNLIIA